MLQNEYLLQSRLIYNQERALQNFLQYTDQFCQESNYVYTVFKPQRSSSTALLQSGSTCRARSDSFLGTKTHFENSLMEQKGRNTSGEDNSRRVVRFRVGVPSSSCQLSSAIVFFDQILRDTLSTLQFRLKQAIIFANSSAYDVWCVLESSIQNARQPQPRQQRCSLPPMRSCLGYNNLSGYRFQQSAGNMEADEIIE